MNFVHFLLRPFLSIEIRALIIKEVLALWRDPKTRITLIVPPIVQLFIFTYAATLEVDNIYMAIYNQDPGKHSIELVQRIAASPRFGRIRYVHSHADLEDAIVHDQALAALEIPSNFSQEIERGSTAPIGLFLDGRNSNASLIISGYVSEIVSELSQDILKNKRRALHSINLITRSWFNPNLKFDWYTVPCLVAILGMLIALIITTLSVAREREMGTFEQLLVSPISPNQILLGKAIPAMVIATLECYLILLISETVIGIPFQGSYLLFTASLLVFLLAVVGVGLFISSLCMTQQQAVLGTFLFMNPAVILSGFAVPLENMPTTLQYLADINPLSHFMTAMKGIYLKNITWSAVATNTWPNLVIAAITLSLAAWLFRQRME